MSEQTKTYVPLSLVTSGMTGSCLGDWKESLKEYQDKRKGYAGLKLVMEKYKPSEVIDMVKDANIRGRGGAGFPAGVKWGFIPAKGSKKHYVCCNADESEPGNFSNRPILEQRPHLLLEGILICAYAVQAEAAYIYIRGEYYDAIRIMEEAIEDARAAGLIGEKILGSNFSCEVHVHAGAGAYICGEETALLESIEGKRGYPRLRPPFPAVEGLYGSPTVINNVETLACAALVFQNGVEWFKSMGTPKSTGTKVYSISGHVRRPGNYEAELGIPLRTLIYDEQFAGGIREGRKFKALFPGGSSVPMMFEDALDCAMDYEGPREFGTFLGAPGLIVMDDSTCMVWASYNLMHFYKHESCGQCTPCREGTGWMYKVLGRLEHGEGRMEDVDQLLAICENISGRSICALGDFATGSVRSGVTRFPEEYREHVRHKRCPFPMDFRGVKPGRKRGANGHGAHAGHGH